MIGDDPFDRLADILSKVKVVSQEEAEKCDYVVCMPADSPSPFTDNLRGHCSVCNQPIIFRPHVPKKPPKVCIHCMNLLHKTEFIH